MYADDHQNPKTQKPYLIVLRKPPRMGCPGEAPGVTHTAPAAQTTRAPITLTARVNDDLGLKGAPLLYYTTTPPADPPDFGAMMQVEMTRTEGDALSGSYEAQVPNPVAGAMGGERAMVYYIIVAKDNDDAMADCDHTTQAPGSGAYSVEVIAGGSATVGFCMACTGDIECGDTNLCVRVGMSGLSYCLADCQGGQACPMGSACAEMPVMGTPGMRRQCVPTTGSCEPDLPPACMDDSFEPNDTRTGITNAMSMDLAGGRYDLRICPAPGAAAANNDDWFRLDITAETLVNAKLEFPVADDLDLRLYDSGGAVVRRSEGVGPTEQVLQCVKTPGVYYLAAYGYMPPTTSSYTMTLSRTPGACCADDPLEPNDNRFQSADTSSALLAGAYTQAGLKVCQGNDDWFGVPMFAGRILDIDLMFTQTSAAGDIDIHVYDKDGTTDLTPCPPVASCMTTNGQGATAPEHMTWTAPADGTYYVVVRGYDANATNDYAISIRRR
jgi:hypothetical protein